MPIAIVPFNAKSAAGYSRRRSALHPRSSFVSVLSDSMTYGALGASVKRWVEPRGLEDQRYDRRAHIEREHGIGFILTLCGLRIDSVYSVRALPEIPTCPECDAHPKRDCERVSFHRALGSPVPPAEAGFQGHSYCKWCAFDAEMAVLRAEKAADPARYGRAA